MAKKYVEWRVEMQFNCTKRVNMIHHENFPDPHMHSKKSLQHLEMESKHDVGARLLFNAVFFLPD